MNAGTFISEPIRVLDASFDIGGMARGEPGLPAKFRWRKKVFVVAEVLEHWKEHGNCFHGSGERYLRRHVYRVRTADGSLVRLYFQRSFGRGKIQVRTRWWIQRLEEDAAWGVHAAAVNA